MTKTLTGMRASLLGAVALAFALLNAGCGGTSTAKSSATPSSPYALGIDDATGAESSGLGSPVTVTNPSGPTSTSPGDIAYYTYATAITPLGSSPPINSGAAGAGPVSPPLGNPVPAGQAGVTFRANIANGVTANGGVPKITSVVLSSTDPQWTLGTLPLTFQYTLATTAGPFVNATYTTAAFTLPFTTSGPHTVSVTVADGAGQSTRTDYVIEVQAATDIAVSINTIPTGAVDASGAAVIYTLAAGDTVTLAGAATQTATADSNGNVLFFAAPGPYTLTVTTAATPPATYTQALDLTSQAPGTTYSQIKKRVGAFKARASLKARH